MDNLWYNDEFNYYSEPSERYYKLTVHKNLFNHLNTDPEGYFLNVDSSNNIAVPVPPHPAHPSNMNMNPPMHTPNLPQSLNTSASNVSSHLPVSSTPPSSGLPPSSSSSKMGSFVSPPIRVFQVDQKEKEKAEKMEKERSEGREKNERRKASEGMVKPVPGTPKSQKRPPDIDTPRLEELVNSPPHKSQTTEKEPNEHSPKTSNSNTELSDFTVPSTRNPEIDLDRTDVYFAVTEQPLKHQVKEFNILPSGVLQLMRHYQPLPADYFLVKLLCDPKMEKGEIFLAAVSAHHSQSITGEIVVPSVKVSQKMLPGRTKGYSFRIMYELVVGGTVLQRETTDEFFLWSNVNQCGYPRKERDAIITQRIESNKTRVKPKGRTPGRPRKRDSDEIEFED